MECFKQYSAVNFQLSNGKKTISRIGYDGPATCYGAKTIAYDSNGIHQWMFKVTNLSKGACVIGIDEARCLSMQHRFYSKQDATGYGYASWNGNKYNGDYGSVFGNKYKTNDTVEMILDLNRKTLSFTLNNSAQKEAFKIKKVDTGYCMAIYLRFKHSSITLLSYKYTKGNKQNDDNNNNNGKLQSEIVRLNMELSQMKKENNRYLQQNNILNVQTKSLNELVNNTLDEANRLKENNKSLQSKIKSLENKNKLQKKKDDAVIHELNKKLIELNAMKEEEKKLEDDSVGIEKVLSDLDNEYNTFKQEYNGDKLQEIYDKTADNLVNKNSSFNKEFVKYKENVDKIMIACKAFNKYIQDIDGMISKLSKPDITKYKSWNVKEILVWIQGLENGRFNKHINKLKYGLEKDGIIGEDLPDLTRTDLSAPPFEIDNFRDKKQLETHFKSLKQHQSMDNHDNNIDNEGAPTAYI